MSLYSEKNHNEREIALKILIRVLNSKAFSNISLNSMIKSHSLNVTEASFVSRMVYGVLEKKIMLDYVISLFSSVKLKKISNYVMNVLRIGVYQVLFMDKVPDFSAVNESVNLLDKQHVQARGFVNAILRTVSRNKTSIDFPTDSVRFSCPEHLIRLWDKSYGKGNTQSILRSLEGRPDLVVRVNTLKIAAQDLINIFAAKGITAYLIDSFDSLRVERTNSIEDLDEFKKGYFHVQDIASQVCCSILAPLPGETIVDVCSAPGGKAFTLAQMMNNTGQILAYDIYQHRVKLINDGALRLGVSIIQATVRDASMPNVESKGFADKVLCDVPCSGLGIIRRKPEIRYKSESDYIALPPLQYSILMQSADLVKKGGLLLYSTCTLNPDENNHIADKFLKNRSDFEAIRIKAPNVVKRTVLEPENQFTIMPGENNSDGFFISLFKRRR